MTNKEKIIFAIKLIIELAVFILLILTIMYLVKSKDGILAKIEQGTAKEKLDMAIKIFSSTDGMKLETAIRAIEGLEDLTITEETGEYNLKIDGQEFMVISKEILPEEEEKSKNVEIEEGKDDGKEN